jgi:signal transduction histidine kinase/CheY-like chemotaxis protein
MWMLLQSIRGSNDHLAVSVADILQIATRHLVWLTQTLFAGIYLFLTATFPGQQGWSTAGILLITFGWGTVALRWIDSRPFASQLLLMFGFLATTLAAAIDLREPQILLLLTLIPPIAFMLSGWPVGAFMLSLCLLVVFVLQRTGFSAVSVSNSVLVLGTASGLIGWVFTRKLLTMAEYLLFSYEQVQNHLDELRENRMILKQREEDLTHANEELFRLTRRLGRLRQEADDARQIKEEFAANVSHELRTPLNMIIAFTELILQGTAIYGRQLPPALLADIRVVHKNSEHLSRLVNDVLDLSQLTAGKMPLLREKFSATDVIEDAMQSVRPLFEARGLYLKAEIEPDLPLQIGDVTRIRQVIINLLSNAGRFTQNGGVIVRASLDGDGVLYAVQDTGPGIPAEAQSRLFEPFQQLDGTTRRKYGGTGLGLSISKQFVEQHDGRIWVESTVGKGSTFYIRLPITASLSLVDQETLRGPNVVRSFVPRMRPYRVRAPHLKPRYLICDPSGVLVRFLSRFLLDAELISMDSIDAAVLTARDVPCEGFILNMRPDQISAWRDRLHEIPYDTPIITCWLPANDIVRRVGKTHYLIKPVQNEALLSAVRGLGEATKTLVVMDDEPDMLRFVARVLGSAGYRIFTADNGSQGLSMVREVRPDALIIDLMMPVMSGFDVLDTLALDPFTASLPTLVISTRDPFNQPILTSEITLTRSFGLTLEDLLRVIQTFSGEGMSAPGRPALQPGP